MVRIAEENDLVQISKILKEVHTLHQNNRKDIFKDFKEPINMDYYKSLIKDNTSEVFVYEIDNLIIGYMTLKLIEVKNHPVLLDRRILKMEDLAILNKFQNNGYGSKLFDKAIEYSKYINSDGLELQVWDFNEKALKFYQNNSMKCKYLTLEKLN